MPRRELKRVVRTGKLTPKQIARDREIRRKVRAEFPPLAQETVPGLLSESLKEAIRRSNMTVYQICKEAGISQIMVSRFVSGERDIRMATADKLASVLELRVTAKA